MTGTTPTSRIEAAARTLYEWQRVGNSNKWENIMPIYRQQYRACVEAILAAADAAVPKEAAEARVNELSEALLSCKQATTDARIGAIVDAVIPPAPARPWRPTPKQPADLDVTQRDPTGYYAPATDAGRCWSELDMG